MERASDDLEEILVIKPAFAFLFKIKLFQLLFWLDFEPVNEKKEQKRKYRNRVLSNLRAQNTGSIHMSREGL